MNETDDIFGYIKAQEEAYKQEIELPGGYMWSMKDHVETSYLYNNSQLKSGKDDFKPVKNITRPILNLQHRTEDLEVKDVQIYVNDSDKYHLSFLVKKYHDDVFAEENDLDTYLDELNVSRIDYGAGLSKKLNKPAPEVVSLHSIAFCDQTDLLSGPIGLKHYYSPDQLIEMEQFGWGNPDNGATLSVKELISLAKAEKKEGAKTNKTPGKYIEIYEVHGNLPKRYVDPLDTSGDYETRLFIVGFYQKKESDDMQGVILYTAIESESPFKLIKRDPVWGRALGFGGAEELFESQVWTNYDMIRIQDMLDAASKTILKTTDPMVANRNQIRNMDNLEIVELSQGTDLSQVDTFPRNLALFERSVAKWEEHAQQMGGATDALFGDNPSAGTPFKLQDQVVQQGLGLHNYRRGIYAKHIEEVYKDWIIPHIEKKICEGAKFLSELSLDELQYVADCMIRNEVNRYLVDKIITGNYDPYTIAQEKELYKAQVTEEFKRKGSNHFIEILKGEFKRAGLSVKVSVAGKSKDLSHHTDALVNVFRQIIANPQVLTIPAMARIFNDILESSGLEPADFSGITQAQVQPQGPNAQQALAPGQGPQAQAPVAQPTYAGQ